MTVDAETAFVRKYIDFLKQLNLYLNHFPRHEKYALCQSIRQDAYNVFDLMVEGQKSICLGLRIFSKVSLILSYQKLQEPKSKEALTSLVIALGNLISLSESMRCTNLEERAKKKKWSLLRACLVMQKTRKQFPITKESWRSATWFKSYPQKFKGV